MNDLYHGRIPSLGADAGLLAAAAASFPGVVPGFPSPFGLGLPPPGIGGGLGPRANADGTLAICDRESPSSSIGSRSPSMSDEGKVQKMMKNNARLSCSSVDGDCEPDRDHENGELPLDTTKSNKHQLQLQCANDGCDQSFVSKHDKSKHERRCHNSSEDATTYADKSPHS